jgi:transcriptional regulatory protein RtcR
LAFAESAASAWPGNFRDLNASVVRMATLAEGGRINNDIVNEEIQQLQARWNNQEPKQQTHVDLGDFLEEAALESMDIFDQHQLAFVIEQCQRSNSLSDAGRVLFNRSRLQKASTNDGHRLRQYLAKFGLRFDDI